MVRRLVERGWTVLARNVRLGRDELDIVAIDPGPPETLVFVEVRSRSGARFGSPEEGIDGRKILRSYRAAHALVRAGAVPDGPVLPRGPWRVDVCTVAWAEGRHRTEPTVRHLRRVIPG